MVNMQKGACITLLDGRGGGDFCGYVIHVEKFLSINYVLETAILVVGLNNAKIFWPWWPVC